MKEYIFSQVPVDVPHLQTKHRKICTPIPSPSTIETIKNCWKYEPYSMNNQLPIVWDKAIDYQIFDNAGNCWIDFTSTIFVANVGHAHPLVCDAILKNTSKGLLNAYYYPTDLRAELTKLLIEITPEKLNKVLLLTTGSESTEAAIKMMKIFGLKNHNKSMIIGLENSFHGKTMGAQMAGGKIKDKFWIGYQHPEMIHIPYPYPWVLEEKQISGSEFFNMSMRQLAKKGFDLSKVAGFITEPYQGWCAAFLPCDYVQEMRKWCDRNYALLAIDEVQSGFGRTGKLFAFEHFGIEPDIICCAKGISSSLPLSAVITGEEIIGDEGSFNSTHGGNPLAVAASIASINVLLNDQLVDESDRKGKLLHSHLLDWQSERPDYITRIYTRGLLSGIFVNNPLTPGDNILFVDKIIERAMQKGLISIRTSSGTLKIGPPLTIPDEALIEGVQVLKESLEECL
ncbi:MAG: aspartate aminotransferase family protein [Parachlamydiaceae bacterium]|nr:aspartate aminotransferase family protein [Parachlamydiaceae bacterium]